MVWYIALKIDWLKWLRCQPHVQYFFLVYMVCDVLFLLLKYKGWDDEKAEAGVRQNKGEIEETRILFFNASSTCMFLARDESRRL